MTNNRATVPESAFYAGGTRYGGCSAISKRNQASRKSFFKRVQYVPSSATPETQSSNQGGFTTQSYVIKPDDIVRADTNGLPLSSGARSIFKWIEKNSANTTDLLLPTKRQPRAKHRFNPISYRAPVRVSTIMTTDPIKQLASLQPMTALGEPPKVPQPQSQPDTELEPERAPTPKLQLIETSKPRFEEPRKLESPPKPIDPKPSEVSLEKPRKLEEMKEVTNKVPQPLNATITNGPIFGKIAPISTPPKFVFGLTNTVTNGPEESEKPQLFSTSPPVAKFSFGTTPEKPKSLFTTLKQTETPPQPVVPDEVEMEIEDSLGGSTSVTNLLPPTLPVSLSTPQQAVSISNSITTSATTAVSSSSQTTITTSIPTSITSTLSAPVPTTAPTSILTPMSMWPSISNTTSIPSFLPPSSLATPLITSPLTSIPTPLVTTISSSMPGTMLTTNSTQMPSPISTPTPQLFMLPDQSGSTPNPFQPQPSAIRGRTILRPRRRLHR